MKTLALALILAGSFAGGAVIAQTVPAQNQTASPDQPATAPATSARAARLASLKGTCGADFEALCPGMQPGDGKLGPCLRANRDKLSKGCTDALGALRAGRAPH